jgi:hypothetical protein
VGGICAGGNSHKEVRAMDAPRFDAWTRRRFGVLTGGLLAAVAGLTIAEEATAKKHKHCKKSETKCGKKCVKGACCPGASCKVNGERCDCGKTLDGEAFGASRAQALCEPCTSDDDCLERDRCAKVTGCPLGVTAICLRPCGIPV